MHAYMVYVCMYVCMYVVCTAACHTVEDVIAHCACHTEHGEQIEHGERRQGNGPLFFEPGCRPFFIKE